MEVSRDSFVFYRSFFESIADLTIEQRGIIFSAVCDYALNGNIPKISGVEKAIFTLIKPQIDANTRRYKNGAKGGRPPKETKPKPNDNLNVTKPKPNHNDHVNVNVNDHVNGKWKPNGKGFDVLDFLEGDDLIDARVHAPGWDIQNLACVYSGWVNEDLRRKPTSPKKAFYGWLPKYTKDKRPS